MVATTDASSWSTAQVAEWLDGLGLGHLKEALIKNGVSGEDLLALSDDGLAASLQANPVQVRKLRHEIAKLSGISPAPLDGIAKGNELKESPYAPAAAVPASMGGAPANFQGGANPSSFPYHSLPSIVNTMAISLFVIYTCIILFSIIGFALFASQQEKDDNWSLCNSNVVVMKMKSIAFINGVCIACQSAATVFFALWLVYNSYQTNYRDFSDESPQIQAVAAFEWLVCICWGVAMVLSIIQLAIVQRHIHNGSSQKERTPLIPSSV